MWTKISNLVGSFAILQRFRSLSFWLLFAGMPGFTLTAVGAIDVQPLNVFLGNNNVAVGETVMVSWQIRNNGSTAAGTSNSQVRITSSNAPNGWGNPSNNAGIPQATGPIGAGVTINQSATVTVPSVPGIYYVWVVADNNSALIQSNPGNDFAVSNSLTVYIPCNYSLHSGGVQLGPNGGNFSIVVMTGPECSWTAVNNSNWITLVSGGGGRWGTGSVDFVADPNPGTGSRNALIRIQGPTGEQNFLVTQLAAPSYANWIASYGLSGPSASGSADGDHDGLPNLAEYVLGGNPKVFDISLQPTVQPDLDNLVFTFSRVDDSETPDVAVAIETSSDLVNWSIPYRVGANTATSSPGVAVTENGTAPDTVILNIPHGNNCSMFARLTVSAAP